MMEKLQLDIPLVLPGVPDAAEACVARLSPISTDGPASSRSVSCPGSGSHRRSCAPISGDHVTEPVSCQLLDARARYHGNENTVLDIGRYCGINAAAHRFAGNFGNLSLDRGCRGSGG